MQECPISSAFVARQTHYPKRSTILLQIASGKLFTEAPKQRNHLRGVLHTNLQSLTSDPIKTAAGTISPTDTSPNPLGQLVYEFTELIEDSPAPGVIASHGIAPYLADFAAIFSIGLNVICTVTPEDASRLTGHHASTNVGYPAKSFVPRVFDRQVLCKADELHDLIPFVHNLIALERRSFLSAMRAIRTYVLALHRLGDDFSLAYTLFVASIESLAQQFDKFQPLWEDYDEGRRLKIDSALENADEDTRRKVRIALLETEKVALARRFREFAMAHIGNAYFRAETEDVPAPAGRADLPEALREAYGIRSRYLHTLTELPRPLTVSAIPGDIVRVEGATLLTFRGITRLARHVIKEFVVRQPKLAKEAYDYRPERYGIVNLPMAPQYWIGRSEKLVLSDGVKRLEGFLTQVSSCFNEDKSAVLTDLQPMLQEAERLMASAGEIGRRPFLALYILFDALLSPERKMANLANIERRYGEEITKPSIESMFVYLLLRVSPGWPLDTYREVYDSYFGQRGKKHGLRVPKTLEAGISLELAEQYRRSGDLENARGLLTMAAEHYPAYKPLGELEERFVPDDAIDWFRIIFPGAATLNSEPPGSS